MIDRITVKGTYKPVNDTAPFVIGNTLFVPNIENTADMAEDVFYKVLTAATKDPKWFVIAEHNFEEFWDAQGRTVAIPDDIKKMLAEVSGKEPGKAEEPKVEEPKVEEVQPEPEKVEEKVEEPKVEEVQPEPEKVEEKTEEPQVETVKDETEEDAKTSVSDSDKAEEPKKKGGRKKKTETETEE